MGSGYREGGEEMKGGKGRGSEWRGKDGKMEMGMGKRGSEGRGKVEEGGCCNSCLPFCIRRL